MTSSAYQTSYRDPNSGSRGDGLLAWLDPGRATNQLRYSSFVGSQAPFGEDILLGLAVDRGGMVTIGGYCHRGGMPTTSGAFREKRHPNGGGPGGNYHLIAARFELSGRGKDDLHYMTYVYDSLQGPRGGGIITAIDVDELGIATLGGWSQNPPRKNPALPPGGGRDAIVMRMDMLPTGVKRFGVSTRACNYPIYQRVDSQPAAGNTRFTVFASGAASNSSGALFFGTANVPGFPVLNLRAHLGTIWLAIPARADGLGRAWQRLPLPRSLPTPPFGVATQWVFLTNAACRGSGLLSASHGMRF